MKLNLTKASMLLVCGMLMACSKPNFGLPEASDNFASSVSYNNKVDILWIVDDSSSMLKHQQNLSTQIPALVSTLNGLKMDYHMAVVTTSMGANPNAGKFVGSPKYLTNSSNDLVSNLQNRMIVGQAGNDNERGLDAMLASLSPSNLNGDGKGFLREDALLVVIALSDEDDKSAPALSTFTSFLNKLKTPWVDGSKSWMFNFIGVLNANSSACTTFNNYAEAGLTYIDLVKQSRGTSESICSSNLSNAVGNIRARIYEILTDFKLSSKPIESTIVVKINGKVVTRSNLNGWDYVAADNVVRFYGSAVPAADESISVDFKPAEAN